MNKLRAITVSLALLGGLTVTPALTTAHAQAVGVEAVELRGLRAIVGERRAPAGIRPQRGVIRLTIPEEAQLVDVARDTDGYALGISMKLRADTREVFQYYRLLMAAQGLELASVDYNVGDSGLFGGGYDSEHIEATFVRRAFGAEGEGAGAGEGAGRALGDRARTGVGAGVGNEGIYGYSGVGAGAGDRVELLIDRESAYGYVVYANGSAFGEGAEEGYGVYEGALYEGAYGEREYGFYGPVGYGGEEDLGTAAEGRRQLRFVAPDGVEAFRLEQIRPDEFAYRYRAEEGIQEIVGFYNRLLVEQGFERVSGEVGAEGGDLLYGAGDERLGLRFEEVGDGVYEVIVDLEPVVQPPGQ